MAKKTHHKIVDESYAIPVARGGGLVKSEVWVDRQGVVVRYSLAYINPARFPGDNGRVLGYDNAHACHHKHDHGAVVSVDDFASYEDLVERFARELRGLLDDHED